MASVTVDLRAELDPPIDEAGCGTLWIVVRARGTGMGMAVDAVPEAVDVHAQDIEPASSHGVAVPADCEGVQRLIFCNFVY